MPKRKAATAPSAGAAAAAGKRRCASGKAKKAAGPTDIEDVCALHRLTGPSVVAEVRRGLLAWYDVEKRMLPWRAARSDGRTCNDLAYAVWVSEIMCQQTQIVTVIRYYERWMARWPTISDLAAATLEDVNEMWAGLGYYSRGRRLLEGAQMVVKELKGRSPTPTTASSSSPAWARTRQRRLRPSCSTRRSGFLDGNVIRVLARLRAIGADARHTTTNKYLWALTNELVDPSRPGDSNQAIMELGARVCTPKSPTCGACPLRTHCQAYALVASPAKRGNPKCALCLDHDAALDAVTVFPQKGKKKAAVEEAFTVLVLLEQRRVNGKPQYQYLIEQRPSSGLLANMWQFPSCAWQPGQTVAEATKKILRGLGMGSLAGSATTDCGAVKHIFSHRRHTYFVHTMAVDELCTPQLETEQAFRIVDQAAFHASAVPTNMKKVFDLVLGKGTGKGKGKKAGKRQPAVAKGQQTLSAFFQQ